MKLLKTLLVVISIDISCITCENKTNDLESRVEREIGLIELDVAEKYSNVADNATIKTVSKLESFFKVGFQSLKNYSASFKASVKDALIQLGDDASNELRHLEKANWFNVTQLEELEGKFRQYIDTSLRNYNSLPLGLKTDFVKNHFKQSVKCEGVHPVEQKLVEVLRKIRAEVSRQIWVAVDKTSALTTEDSASPARNAEDLVDCYDKVLLGPLLQCGNETRVDYDAEVGQVLRKIATSAKALQPKS